MIRIKTSNKLLTVIALLPFMIAIVLMLSLRTAFEKSRYKDAPAVETASFISKTTDLNDFNEIEVNGAWDITLSRGDASRVEISAPGNIINAVGVYQSGEKVTLYYRPDIEGSGGAKILKATIMTPSMSTISLAGECRIDISGIRTEYLSMDLDGIIEMTASDAVIGDLNLIGDGKAFVDLSGASIVNARIKYNGTYTMDLYLNGGRLSGKLNGIGTLTYSGNADVKDLKTGSPWSRIIHP